MAESVLNPFYWIRRCYDWVLRWADHRHSTKALSAIAVIEAIFFPIPADVLLIAMGAARPKKALWYALVCSVSSVTGGLLGYVIGMGFWHVTQGFFFSYVFSPEIFQVVVQKFSDNAFFSVFIASFTPIPFKVFTIAAGVAQINLMTFFLAAAIGRSLRFFLVGTMLYIFGAPIRVFIEKHFEKLTVLGTVLLILGFYVLKYIR